MSKADETRRLLASIIENSDDAIINKNLDGTVTQWNKSAERMFGFRASEIIGKSVALIIPPEHIAEERRILRGLRQGQRIHHYQTVRRRKDGELIHVSISISPIRGVDGRVVGVCNVTRDITEQKRAEKARMRQEEMLRAILDTAGEGIIAIDDKGIIQSANAMTQQLFGYAPTELIGSNVNRLMPEPFHSEHDGYIRNYCRTGRAKIIGIGREVSGLRKDGTTFPMHLAVSEVKLEGQRIFAGIVHDLTERRRLERQIMETAANEQRRIGQDLHDGLCQDLVGIAFGIDAASRKTDSQAKSELMKLATAVRDAANQARRLAHGLNPVDLRAGGVATALEHLAAKVTQSFGVLCTFKWDHAAHVNDDVTATHLYRIAQEAISNAVRHGNATRIKVSFRRQRDLVSLEIGDNGKGMPGAAAENVKKGLVLSGTNMSPTSGMGLQTMHYRARVMGGTFSVVSRKGHGTTVICRLGREQTFRADQISMPRSGNVRRVKRRFT